MKLQLVEQGRLQTGSTAESGLLQKLADTSVESFDHAIRLRMRWRRQTVFDAHGGADFIEGVLVAGFPVFCCAFNVEVERFSNEIRPTIRMSTTERAMLDLATVMPYSQRKA